MPIFIKTKRYFINLGFNSFNSNSNDKKYLIKCNDTKCTEISPSAGSVYFNKNLIKTIDNDYSVNDQLIIYNSIGF